MTAIVILLLYILIKYVYIILLQLVTHVQHQKHALITNGTT